MPSKRPLRSQQTLDRCRAFISDRPDRARNLESLIEQFDYADDLICHGDLPGNKLAFYLERRRALAWGISELAERFPHLICRDFTGISLDIRQTPDSIRRHEQKTPRRPEENPTNQGNHD
jgi:hypothetical protein